MGATTDAIISIVIGGFSLLYSFTGRQFYALKGRFSAGRPIPTWTGRLIFAVAGTLFVLIGIAQLLFRS